MAERKKSADERKRNMAMVLYEDSAPTDWKERLEELHTPAFYILHDKDVNPTGEPKKPHYHIMLMFEGKKSPAQFEEIAKNIGSANGQYQVVNSLRGMARYLIHLDNPDKTQYSANDVVRLSGADYITAINIATDKYKAINEMIYYIEENNIVSFRQLVLYAMNNNEEWFHCLTDNSAKFMMEYLKSRKWELDEEERNQYK